MMNKVIEEQDHDPDWPGGKFTRIWARIKADEKPDDTMAELELDEDLRKITLSRKKDPKDLLAEISAIEIKFGIKISAVKKAASILRAGQRDYAQVMTITCTIMLATHKREATPEELVDSMHKQWRIQGNKERTSKKVEDDGHETALADVNENGARCYECGSPHHKRNQCPHRKKGGRGGNKGGGNHNNGRNGKPKGKKFKGVCNHCGKSGHEEKDCWKKHPDKIPAKFAKSGAAISDEIFSHECCGFKCSCEHRTRVRARK